MFTTKPATQTDHDIVMAKIYTYLKNQEVSDPKYGDVIDHLVKLQKLKDTNPSRLSSDAKAAIVTNLTGILAIIGYERIHVITTKAISMVGKLR